MLHDLPCPAPFSLTAHVLGQTGARPDKIALRILRPDGDADWSYRRLGRAVGGLTGALLALNLPPGSVVLLRLGNGPARPCRWPCWLPPPPVWSRSSHRRA